MTERQEKRLGWAIVAFVLTMVLGPLGGSSLVVGVVAIWHSFNG